MELDITLLQGILRKLHGELVHGPSETECWVLDMGALGLLGELGALSAEEASRCSGPERKSIAAHASHLRYSFELLNRWAGGEENPFADADWAGSWATEVVDNDAWSELISQLHKETEAWGANLQQSREWDEMALTGVVACSAHLAYHLGAIRQLVLLNSGQ